MPQIRAILLDAVGTTIYPAEDVGHTYAEQGRRHGSSLPAGVILTQFRQAFRREEEVDRAKGYVTSEEREQERWRRIIAEVFMDVSNPEALFRELWDHYSHPAAWRVFPDVASFRRSAAGRDIRIILASNFDARLRAIVRGLSEVAGLTDLAISSEIGWKKPSSRFYAAVLSGLRLTPQEVLAIGDDPVTDYEGATSAGLASFLLDRRGKSAESHVIKGLGQGLVKLGGQS